MSSILIKGMEMPKHSRRSEMPELYSIKFKVYPDGSVEAYKSGSYEKHETVSIPAPHGDLIDRSSINDCLGTLVNLPAPAACAFLVAEISNAKTIIEAEG